MSMRVRDRQTNRCTERTLSHMEEEEEERERKQCTERVVSKGLPGAPAIPLNEHI